MVLSRQRMSYSQAAVAALQAEMSVDPRVVVVGEER